MGTGGVVRKEDIQEEIVTLEYSRSKLDEIEDTKKLLKEEREREREGSVLRPSAGVQRTKQYTGETLERVSPRYLAYIYMQIYLLR